MSSDRTPEYYNVLRAGRVRQLVVHCSGTPNGQPLSLAEIDAWHRKREFLARAEDFRRRFNPTLSHIGYHNVIHVTGAYATARHPDEMGQHVQGHNLHSFGIMLVGLDRFTRAQWMMLRANVWALQQRYPGVLTYGHRDLSPDLDGDGTVEPHEWLKTCPGFAVSDWIAGGMEPPAGHVLAPPPPAIEAEGAGAR